MIEYQIAHGAKNTKVVLNIGVKASEVTSAKLIIKYPDQTTYEVPLTLPEPNLYSAEYIDSDGYLTAQAGVVYVQVEITQGNRTKRGLIDHFEVIENL